MAQKITEEYYGHQLEVTITETHPPVEQINHR